MPSSSFFLLGPVIRIVRELNPSSVLDVGCGAGKWGVLCREYLDLWDGRESVERRVKIDAIEIFLEYLGDLHRAVYDRVHVGNAVDILEGAQPSIEGGFRLGAVPRDRWDLILCADMIEHLSDVDGSRFIEAALARADALLVTTPQNPTDQGAVFGNEHERHVSRWTPQDFEPYGWVQGWAVDGFWIVLVKPRRLAAEPLPGITSTP